MYFFVARALKSLFQCPEPLYILRFLWEQLKHNPFLDEANISQYLQFDIHTSPIQDNTAKRRSAKNFILKIHPGIWDDALQQFLISLSNAAVSCFAPLKQWKLAILYHLLLLFMSSCFYSQRFLPLSSTVVTEPISAQTGVYYIGSKFIAR